jgi:hypothetical protein
MAHYKGWTVVISFDSIDGDWGAQAIRGTYKTVADYFKANRKEKSKLLLLDQWYDSKEKVFEAIKLEIEKHCED